MFNVTFKQVHSEVWEGTNWTLCILREILGDRHPLICCERWSRWDPCPFGTSTRSEHIGITAPWWRDTAQRPHSSSGWAFWSPLPWGSKVGLGLTFSGFWASSISCLLRSFGPTETSHVSFPVSIAEDSSALWEMASVSQHTRQPSFKMRGEDEEEVMKRRWGAGAQTEPTGCVSKGLIDFCDMFNMILHRSNPPGAPRPLQDPTEAMLTWQPELTDLLH